MVLARGRTLLAAMLEDVTLPLLATEFLRTLLLALEAAAPLTLSLLPARGRDDAGLVMCNFCWWRSKRSRRAKHLVHSGHSNGFSFVCERSWRFKCSSRAKDLVHVAQTCGRGLSVFGGGNCAAPWGLGLSLLGGALSVEMLDDHVVRSDMGAVYLLPTLGLRWHFDSGPATWCRPLPLLRLLTSSYRYCLDGLRRERRPQSYAGTQRDDTCTLNRGVAQMRFLGLCETTTNQTAVICL